MSLVHNYIKCFFSLKNVKDVVMLVFQLFITRSVQPFKKKFLSVIWSLIVGQLEGNIFRDFRLTLMKKEKGCIWSKWWPNYNTATIIKLICNEETFLWNIFPNVFQNNVLQLILFDYLHIVYPLCQLKRDSNCYGSVSTCLI